MRIEGPRGPDSIRKNEKTRKTGGASSDFKSFLDGDADGASEVASAPMMGGIGALIAAQATEDPLEGKKRKYMKERAGRVLEALEGVHKGLLSGRLSVSEMEGVSRAITERREKIADPRLTEILDEVELRAQVELAKMEMAKEKGQN